LDGLGVIGHSRVDVGLATDTAMIYLKSVCVGLAFVLGAFYAIFFLAVIVLRIVVRPQGQVMAFSISLHSTIFWLSFVFFFACGYSWAHRRFSRESPGTLK
jgi:hypothetical protein